MNIGGNGGDVSHIVWGYMKEETFDEAIVKVEAKLHGTLSPELKARIRTEVDFYERTNKKAD